MAHFYGRLDIVGCKAGYSSGEGVPICVSRPRTSTRQVGRLRVGLRGCPDMSRNQKMPAQTHRLQDHWVEEMGDTIAVTDGIVVRMDRRIRPPKKIIIDAGRRAFY